MKDTQLPLYVKPNDSQRLRGKCIIIAEKPVVKANPACAWLSLSGWSLALLRAYFHDLANHHPPIVHRDPISKEIPYCSLLSSIALEILGITYFYEIRPYHKCYSKTYHVFDTLFCQYI